MSPALKVGADVHGRHPTLLTDSPSGDDAGVPTWRASATGRTNFLGMNTGTKERPSDDRVRVPHLACLELVTSPDRRRHATDLLEDTAGHRRVITKPPRTVDGVVNVRNDAVLPTPDLVAEQPHPPREAGTDWSFAHNAALGSVAPRRRLFDDEPPVRNNDHESRVIQVIRRSMRQPCRDGLENFPVKPHRVAAGAERQPVEVDGRPRSTRRITREPVSAEGLHVREYRSGTVARPRSGDWPDRTSWARWRSCRGVALREKQKCAIGVRSCPSAVYRETRTSWHFERAARRSAVTASAKGF
jgi:hypothetical protein